jgi:hypothetical protein
MRIFEIATGWQVPISNEEYSVLKKINQDTVKRSQLTDRESVLANQLVVKDLLIRKNLGGETHYKRQTGTRKVQ